MTHRVTESVESEERAFPTRKTGPHCAVGRILYPEGPDGVLLYIKSSLTGDEDDYILDYKDRNPRFPHETTNDQFFTEEQFEVYRALGFHAADGFFGGHKFAAAWPSSQEAMMAIRAL